MRLEILVTETKDITLSRQRTTKAQIRLRGCAGWSAPLLFAYDIRHVFSWPGSISKWADWFHSRGCNPTPPLNPGYVLKFCLNPEYSPTCVKDHLWTKTTCLQRPLQMPVIKKYYINYPWTETTCALKPEDCQNTSHMYIFTLKIDHFLSKLHSQSRPIRQLMACGHPWMSLIYYSW